MIKAIDTVYNGYKFRSRLEARWAVFFDTLGIQWEYEKEGYELGNGKRYLPDFWLTPPPWPCGEHTFGYYFEVKGQKPLDEEVIRMKTIVKETSKAGFLAWGSPGGKRMALFHHSGGEMWFDKKYPDDDDDSIRGCGCLYVLCSFPKTPPPEVQVRLITNAVTAARSARFEFNRQ